jgi:hypothetical protein
MRCVHCADGQKVPVFWGYLLPRGTPLLTKTLLDTHRLALVFDLDETLLSAFSQSSLQSKINDLK